MPRTTPTSWRAAGSSWTARRTDCGRTRISASSISAREAVRDAAIVTSSNTAGPGAGMVSPELALSGVCLAFGGLKVLEDVSFEVKQGELLALIGPNGAGKTSVLNCICGLYRAHAGTILLREERIERSKAHEIARLGVAR